MPAKRLKLTLDREQRSAHGGGSRAVVGEAGTGEARRLSVRETTSERFGLNARSRADLSEGNHALWTDPSRPLDGSRLTAASQLRRIAELPDVLGVTALGLRNVKCEEANGMRELGVRFATTLDLLDRGPQAVADELVPTCDAIYVSIDLDVLDLGLVPGTTLPEPGGLSYRELCATLAAIARRGRIVAFDIAELNPPADSSGRPHD